MRRIFDVWFLRGRPRKRYSADFKVDAVAMVVELGKSIASTARELGIHEGTLGSWVAQWRLEHPEEEKSLGLSEREAWQRDQAELRRLRMENEFLKKAAALDARGHD
ncbi:transposase [Buchananella hordeovulneris]|uniref:Transposase n=1 Tax=Buchananella hordeovulneris TaxID=52770 RepID=A0A1Q5PS35_9ACTO|nr:transposase [Buchananella hordeovulneris]OKL50398.1 hypothetical protein BSZ40_11155 [Buchananella hordeovulneris]